MPKLVAAAIEDGWAIVEEGCELRSIRPPYNRRDARLVSNAAVATAIQLHGFELIGQDFEDWRGLIDFLEVEMVRTRVASGQSPPADFRGLLKFADRATLARYLDRVEATLLVNREWHAAFDVLTSLLETDGLNNDAELFRRAVALLRLVNAQFGRADCARQTFVEREDIDQRFPNAVEHYGADPIRDYARAVRLQKSVFALSA